MIDPGRTYWLVNKPNEVKAAGLGAYLDENRWLSATPESHHEKLAPMRPGDPIACKSVTHRSRDLPFFAGDNKASVMTVHAVGAIRAADPDSGVVEVDWTPQQEGRE